MLTQIILITLLRAQSGMSEHGRDLPGIVAYDDVPQIFVPSPQERRACYHLGEACFSPGGSQTSEGMELRAAASPITVLARGAQVAAVGGWHGIEPNQAWQVQFVANLAHRSGNGPIVVAVLDAEDAEAMAAHYALALWDIEMQPSDSLGMRFLLSPELGFRPSHTYLLRMVQGRGTSERILAQGELRLE